jgi:hypothetical protein
LPKIEQPEQEGTSRVKTNRTRRLVDVSADGPGIVSHAGSVLLRELAEQAGLTAGWTAALIDTYRDRPIHAPGQVLVDLAVSIADGGDALRHLSVLRDQHPLFGPVASDATAWRVLDRVDEPRLAALRAARAAARARVWAAGGGPDLGRENALDFDAAITIAHSDKDGATPTWKRTFGFHPLLCYLDRPELSGGEALAGLLRPGRAGSNTAADHIAVLDLALAALPEHARPRPGDPDGPRWLARADSAGATHGFLAALRARGLRFSVGFDVDAAVRAAILALPESVWQPAVDTDGQPRDGAWVAEITGLVDLSGWPQGSRLIVRRERPHPGAQYTLFDPNGYRHTAFLTDTPGRGNDLAALELRHRQHARVEDRIRCGKATGLRNLPCRGWNENAAWVELALTAADLLTWAQALCFDGELRRVEPATLRHRVLHTAGRLIRSGRRTRLKLAQNWPWSKKLAAAFSRLRAAPWPT